MDLLARPKRCQPVALGGPPRTPDSREAAGPRRKSGLKHHYTKPRLGPAERGSRPPRCMEYSTPSLNPTHALTAARLLPTPPKIFPATAFPTVHLPPAIKIGALGRVPGPSLLSRPRETVSKIFPKSHCQGPKFPPLCFPSGCLQTSPCIPRLHPPPSLIHFPRCFPQERAKTQGPQGL